MENFNFLYPISNLRLELDINKDLIPDAGFSFQPGKPMEVLPLSQDELEIYKGFFSQVRLEVMRDDSDRFLIFLRGLWNLPSDKQCRRSCKFSVRKRTKRKNGKGGGPKF